MRQLRQHAGFVRGGLILLALLGCRVEPGDAWARALAAGTWDDARDACAALDEPAECLVAAMEQHGRLDRADCDAVPPGLWKDECVFRYAERAAKAGEHAAAVEACNGTRFGRECAFHLVRAAAEAVWDRPMAEAATAAAAWQGLDRAPDASRLFWRSWFRKRQGKGLALDPGECPDPTCRDGARETLYLTLTGLARAAGEGFCAGPPPDGTMTDRRLWASTPETEEWVERWVRSECMRRQVESNKPASP